MKAALLSAAIIVCSSLSCRRHADAAARDPVQPPSAGVLASRPPIIADAAGPWHYQFTPEEEQQIQANGDLQALLHNYLNAHGETVSWADRTARFNRLSPEEFRLLILKAMTSTEPGPLLAEMGQRHPAECATLLSQIVPRLDRGPDPATYALVKIAEAEPGIAIKWIDEHAYLFNEESLGTIKLFSIGGIACRNPSLAFQTADRWELSQDGPTIRQILSSPETFEGKAETVALLRARIAVEPDPSEAAKVSEAGFSGLGYGLGADYDSCNFVPNEGGRSFEQVTAFLKKLNLRPEETEQFSDGFIGPDNPADLTKWIEWTRENTKGDRISSLEELRSTSAPSKP